MGWPQMGSKGLRGSREDSRRAGITPTILAIRSSSDLILICYAQGLVDKGDKCHLIMINSNLRTGLTSVGFGRPLVLYCFFDSSSHSNHSGSPLLLLTYCKQRS